LSKIPIPTPPASEQVAIATLLDTHARRADDLVDGMQHQVSLLAEHRQGLITAAVTGELDVTKAA
jgi:type I restriction enzyme S subunit